MDQVVPAKELIRRWMGFKPVTSAIERVNALVDDVRHTLKEAGVHTVLEHLPDGRAILYASTRRSKEPDLLLNAHLDVVPADDTLFTMREDGDTLYGRGVHDCLGNCAVIVNVLARLVGKASVGAIFSTDEETGGQTTAFMVQKGYRARKLVLVLDGGGNAITVAQKGILNVTLRASGKACHAAEPWKGDNAIDLLLDGYLKIRDAFRAATAADPWHDTMAATVLHAGTVHNRVPDIAELNLNIRFTTPGGENAILELIRERSGLEVVANLDCQPVAFSADTPAIHGLLEHMRQSLGREITVCRMNGATDARHFVAPDGPPVAIIGVPGHGAHAVVETLDAKALIRYEEMLVSFVEKSGLPISTKS